MEKLQYKRIDENTVEIDGVEHKREGVDTSFKAFSKAGFVVNCKTEEDTREFLAFVGRAGIKWYGGCSTLGELNYRPYKDKTCYSLNYAGKGFGYSGDGFYESEGAPIVPYSRDLLMQWEKEREES